MGAFKDLTGKRFGRLTALSRGTKDSWGTHYWLCRCDCGVEKLILGASLTRGATTSCGCLRKEKPALYRTEDLTGKRFGRLIVKSMAGVNKSNSCLWLCQCDCGNTKITAGYNLQKGDTQSCGCYNKERVHETHFVDITNRRFGRLVALRCVGLNKHGTHKWECRCDCGNVTISTLGNLISGNTSSCGCYNTERSLEANLGANNHAWKGGITLFCIQIRNLPQYSAWRDMVFQRDNFTCQECNQLRGNINAHHIVPFSRIIEDQNVTTLEEAIKCKDLWDVSNGITLCLKCHKKVHRMVPLTKRGSKPKKKKSLDGNISDFKFSV